MTIATIEYILNVVFAADIFCTTVRTFWTWEMEQFLEIHGSQLFHNAQHRWHQGQAWQKLNIFFLRSSIIDLFL